MNETLNHVKCKENSIVTRYFLLLLVRFLKWFAVCHYFLSKYLDFYLCTDVQYFTHHCVKDTNVQLLSSQF